MSGTQGKAYRMLKKRHAAIALVLALMLSACTSRAAREAEEAESSGPIKIGLVAVLSGPLAEIGEAHKRGAELAVKQINDAGGINGRSVELQVKDEKGDPNASVQAARELLSDGTKLIAGYTLDPDCLAAAPIINDGGGLLVGLSCQGDALTQDSLVDNYFQIAPSNTMLANATAKVAADSGLTSWQGIGPDYAFGHEVWQRFSDALVKQVPGVELRKSVYVPLEATQVAPYINSLIADLPADSAKTTGLFMSTFSATTIGLAQQGEAYGFFDKYGEVLNLGGSTPTAEALKADTPPITFVYDYFDEAYDNPTNTAFVEGYRAAYGNSRPNAWAYEGYVAVLAIKAAIEKAGSSNADEVAEAMKGLRFDGPKGNLEFRAEDHLLMSPVTAWKVVGNSNNPEGFDVLFSRAIPAEEVAPSVS